MLADLPKCKLLHFLLRELAYSVWSHSFKEMVKNDSACSATAIDGTMSDDFHALVRCVSL